MNFRSSSSSRWAALALMIFIGTMMGADDPQAQPKLAARDVWDAVYIGQTKIGFVHTKVTPLKDGRGRDIARVETTAELNAKRDKDTSRIRTRLGIIELPDGQLLRLDYRYQLGGQEMRTYADVVSGKMTVKLVANGRETGQTIDCGPEVRGPYGPEHGMLRQPMKPGESRQLIIFMPELAKKVTVSMVAHQMEDVSIGGKPRPLLRVETKLTDADGKPMPAYDTTYYVDERGEFLKSVMHSFGGMITYRTTEKSARAKDGALDLIAVTVAKTARQINEPYATREATYNVSMKSGDVAKLIAADRRQTLTPGSDPRVALLTVRLQGVSEGAADPARPGDEYLKASPLIDSGDAKVVQHAKAAVGNETRPWEQTKKIIDWVHQNVSNKNFETSFATATDVARSLSGDCTEHSVLAAAMCRSVGIPARVAVGLIYVKHLGGFGFHMWNEVYVNDRWVAVDAAFRQTDVDAVHIKLSDSSLSGVSAFDQFQSVLEVVNKITIEPVSVK